jgi:hypothetical protein
MVAVKEAHRHSESGAEGQNLSGKKEVRCGGSASRHFL